MSDPLYSLAEAVGQTLAARDWRLAVAESCTGGGIGEAITRVPGSSVWFDRAFVVYSNTAKQEMLSVKAATLQQYGAVSQQVAEEMVFGALAHSPAEVALAVTGIAGPDGGTAEKPVGTVWFAWCREGGSPVTKILHFSGDRAAVRAQAIEHALHGILALLKNG
jgi:nicotinamide-nucleotide amidase